MTNDLTPRDLIILRLAAHGYTNREISSAIGLSEKSVEHMMSRTDDFRGIYAKIGVKNRAAAVTWYTAHYSLHHPIHPTRAADYLLELATDYVRRVYQMRISGNTCQAIEMAHFITTVLGEAAHKACAAGYRERLLTIRARALMEQGIAYLEIASSHEVIQMMQPIFDEMRMMAKETSDGQLVGRAHLLRAGASNIAENYANGMTYYATALEMIDDVDLTLRCMRGIAIAATYLNMPKVVEAVTKKVRRLIDRGQYLHIEEVSATLAGVGRAQGLMGSPAAYQDFADAEDLLAAPASQSPPTLLPFRRLQLITSRLEVMRYLTPNEKTAIESLGQQGMMFARPYNYPRHIGLIERWLSETSG